MQALRDSAPRLCEALPIEGADDAAMVLYHVLIFESAPLLSGAVVVVKVGIESRLIAVALERLGPVDHTCFVTNWSC